MSDVPQAVRASTIMVRDDEPPAEKIPRLDCAIYIMEITRELAKMSEDAELSHVIGSSLRMVTRAARKEMELLNVQRAGSKREIR